MTERTGVSSARFKRIRDKFGELIAYIEQKYAYNSLHIIGPQIVNLLTTFVKAFLFAMSYSSIGCSLLCDVVQYSHILNGRCNLNALICCCHVAHAVSIGNQFNQISYQMSVPTVIASLGDHRGEMGSHSRSDARVMPCPAIGGTAMQSHSQRLP